MLPSSRLITVSAILFLLNVVDSKILFDHVSEGSNNNNNNGETNKETSKTCGYSSCPSTDPNRVNIHIIAHTHDDVGWLKTVDQYYYGTNRRFSMVGVQYILDSVIPQLLMDSSRRFIYVEMSFFSKWWLEQDEPMKRVVRSLVDQGRLEFINGGWCMNDEATVNYQSTIEQMTLGLRFLNETFGSCGHPKVGWQIDPFGHSSEQASLFAQFGFDGMFFTRVSYRDKEHRTHNKSLDFLWQADRALDDQSGSIFTNLFRDGYDAPNGFCYDAICLDDSLVDNKNSFEYNIDKQGQKFIKYLRVYAQAKLTNHVLIPMGGDFQFSAAGQNFKNLDKLMRYVRENAPELNIFYSTPSCYQYSVNLALKSKSLVLPEKYDDFMPYDSHYSVWWSGYFSSRPSVKLVERQVADLLQVTRMISLANLLKPQSGRDWLQQVKEHEEKCLMPLWEILGDLQHHDAITGTEKQHVSDDYVRRAWQAQVKCAKFLGELRRNKLSEFLKKSPRYEQLRDSAKKLELDPVYLEETLLCPQLNISQCEPIESEIDTEPYSSILNLARNSRNEPHHSRSRRWTKYSDMPAELLTKSVLINVYNPMSRPISQHDIRLPCNGGCDLSKVRVVHVSTNETMKLIRLPISFGIQKLPFRSAITTYEILFYANLPALGYTSFVVEDTNTEQTIDDEEILDDSIVIGDEQKSAGKQQKSRRLRRSHFDEFQMSGDFGQPTSGGQQRSTRDSSKQTSSQSASADKVIVKFDTNSGMIVGLRRVTDGSTFSINQKFGFYYPAALGHQPGAYIFRPNSSEPELLDKPVSYKIFKRRQGALIEIQQKWADWIWQTIRVDAKKNYIEFDYLVGPIPTNALIGKEIITRYETNLANGGAFLTDSNGRQMMLRQRMQSDEAEQLGGSFFPVTSSVVLRNNAELNSTRGSVETVAILVDRPQAATSLHEGQLELLVHRRLLQDDNFGVAEALDEPGEDNRGLVTRGTHRLYLKFRDHQADQHQQHHEKRSKSRLLKLAQSPRANLTFAKNLYTVYNKRQVSVGAHPTYLLYDQVFDDLNVESRKHLLRPLLTFDRLRVGASEFMEMLALDGQQRQVKTDLSLLNMSLPNNIHLLTLQPWNNEANTILIRLENLDNPVTLHPFPHFEAYESLVRSYSRSSKHEELNDVCSSRRSPIVQLDVEYLIKRIRISSLQELNLGANSKYLEDFGRLEWPNEADNCKVFSGDIQKYPHLFFSKSSPTVNLSPRQIGTYLASFEFL